MTYHKLLSAVPAFQKLVGQNLPLKTAYRLSKIVRKVNEELDFFREKEVKLKGRHEYSVPPEEYNELLNLEIDWDEPKVEIPLDENVSLSAADVEALDEFVSFKEVNEDA